jgi:hypothetical protein
LILGFSTDKVINFGKEMENESKLIVLEDMQERLKEFENVRNFELK